MKPFCLDKALSGSPVCTRDGREVTEIHYFKTAIDSYPVVAVADECLNSYTMDGKKHESSESTFDLFLAPTKKTYWVNLYKNNAIENWPLVKGTWLTKEEAERAQLIMKGYQDIPSDDNGYIGTFPIEITEE